MDNFCGKCGTQISGNAKFCSSCGSAIKTAPKVVFSAPASPGPNSSITPQNGVITIEQNTRLLKNVLQASHMPGETVFTSATEVVTGVSSSITTVIGPFRILQNFIKSFGKGFKEVLKNPKKMLPAFILSLVWFALTLLPKWDVKVPYEGVLNWLTFSKAGLSGGNLSMVGGVLGKGIFAGFFTSFIMSLVAKKNPFSNLFGGFKAMISSFNLKSFKLTGVLLLGAGLALIVNNFLTGDNSLENSMLGILASLASIRALGTKNSLLKKLIASFFPKLNSLSKVNAVIAGLASGFVFTVALSKLNISFIGYVVGGCMIIVGIIMHIIARSKKEVAKV